jgi:hypothetical protein
MPHFRLLTNVPASKIPKNFLQEMTTLLAKSFGRHEGFFCTVIPDQLMTRGGTNEPCATVSLMSILKLGPTDNIAHSKVIFEKVCTDLRIAKDRMLIEFDYKQAYELGFNGTTVEEFLKKSF